MKDQTLIPEATPPLDGEYVVELSLAQVAKNLFSNKMALRGITRAELSRLSGIRPPELTQPLNLQHASKIDRLDKVASTLGKKLVLSIE